MSKHILFLYSDSKYKNEIIQYEDVLKTLFRKFRKSVVFSYRYVDISPYKCREEADSIIQEVRSCDAAIWYGRAETLAEENLFARNFLGVFAEEFSIGGRCIFSPVSKTSFSCNEETLRTQKEISLSNIEKAISVCTGRTKERKHSLLLCHDIHTSEDALFLNAFENSLGQEKSIVPTYCDFDELVMESTYRIPSFDVLLTTEEKARILRLHLSSLQKTPCGSIVWHSDSTPFFRRDILPYEELRCGSGASFLLSCADAVSMGMGEKSIGQRLRRSVALSLELTADKTEFINEIIRLINSPIRKRKVKTDDSNN